MRFILTTGAVLGAIYAVTKVWPVSIGGSSSAAPNGSSIDLRGLVGALPYGERVLGRLDEVQHQVERDVAIRVATGVVLGVAVATLVTR